MKTNIFVSLAVSVCIILTMGAAPAFASWDDEVDTGVYRVLVIQGDRYSIWPMDQENPLGWKDAGKSGSKDECLDYIKKIWTDLRPRELRQRMEDAAHGRRAQVAPASAALAAFAGGGAVAASGLQDEAVILKPTDRITAGAGDVALRDQVDQTLEAGHRKIVLNMASVTRIDSSGMGELVSAYTRVHNQGGRLKLCCLPKDVSELLQLHHLLAVIPEYPTEAEAITSFGK